MSEIKIPIPFAKERRRLPRVERGSVKPAAVVPKNAHKIGGRHAAITNNLNNWNNYKNWASRIRDTWEEKK